VHRQQLRDQAGSTGRATVASRARDAAGDTDHQRAQDRTPARHVARSAAHGNPRRRAVGGLVGVFARLLNVINVINVINVVIDVVVVLVRTSHGLVGRIDGERAMRATHETRGSPQPMATVTARRAGNGGTSMSKATMGRGGIAVTACLALAGMASGVAGAATTAPWQGPSPGVTATAPGDGPPILTIDHRNGAVDELHLNAPIVGHVTAPNRGGQWLVASDGGVFTFGSAKFYGSMAGKHLNAPVVGMAATPDGHGYWLVAADGGVFAFGSARFYGSVPGAPSSEWVGQPVVGITATAGGTGYDLTTASGTVYAVGAQFPEGYGGVAFSPS